jgi:hypothetical protein
MKDGKLKRWLESAAECVHALTAANVYDELSLLSKLEAAPSKQYAAVLEAVVILVTPNNRFQPPERYMKQPPPLPPCNEPEAAALAPDRSHPCPGQLAAC